MNSAADNHNLSRREMLEWSTWGLTGAALTNLVQAAPQLGRLG